MSGPRAISKPIERNTSMISSITSVSGWTRPRSRRLPGSVMSIRSSASAFSRLSPLSVFKRPSISASMKPRSWFSSSPRLGRSSGATSFRPRSRPVVVPLRPRYSTRSCSTSASETERPIRSRTSSLSGARASFIPNARTETLCREAGLGELGDLAEGGGVGDGDFRQDFSVQLHPGVFQPLDQLAVGQPGEARRGVDPGDPQSAELAPADPAVPVGEGEPALGRLSRPTIEIAAPSDVSLGQLEDFFPPLPGFTSSLGSRHWIAPFYKYGINLRMFF